VREPVTDNPVSLSAEELGMRGAMLERKLLRRTPSQELEQRGILKDETTLAERAKTTTHLGLALSARPGARELAARGILKCLPNTESGAVAPEALQQAIALEREVCMWCTPRGAPCPPTCRGWAG
jgi:hypothetical protein